METFSDCKPFVHNPSYQTDRKITLDNLDANLLDAPLVKLVYNINKLPYLFTLQCCHGHFLKKDGEEIVNLELPGSNELVEYRLAYIAFCIENSPSGRKIRQKLMNIPLTIDRDTIQFCSAQWFWDQWLNSYAIQIMPTTLKDLDSAQIKHSEAREVAKVRDACFASLNDIFSSL